MAPCLLDAMQGNAFGDFQLDLPGHQAKPLHHGHDHRVKVIRDQLAVRITPARSVHGMRALVENFRPEMSGRFFRYDGTEIPW